MFKRYTATIPNTPVLRVGPSLSGVPNMYSTAAQEPRDH
eukprot:CAMPEP_0168484314 /NCGR_PEP_ID=MMETSP0228-20121227/66036_1 /TAXON_ID=133427 /ORGANISM="Protoceratium reticulatum, Strain CCCM 535 (=CCMP 1889)" /LENGTH=38 /DNA_ID= /DNA_START= /DNA_END= /DNA_ORIENTATION=